MKEHQSRTKLWRRRVSVFALAATFFVAAPLVSGCGDDEVVDNAPQQKQASKKKKRKKAAPAAPAENAFPPQKGERVAGQGRDPFYGFVDEMIAERRRAAAADAERDESEEEPLKPAQRYDVLDFKLVAIITNTAQPKALLIDPTGVPHRLRTGDLIGRKNGVIVDIRRSEIEVLQGENLLEGERVVMQLHPELGENFKFEVN